MDWSKQQLALEHLCLGMGTDECVYKHGALSFPPYPLGKGLSHNLEFAVLGEADNQQVLEFLLSLLTSLPPFLKLEAWTATFRFFLMVLGI